MPLAFIFQSTFPSPSTQVQEREQSLEDLREGILNYYECRNNHTDRSHVYQRPTFLRIMQDTQSTTHKAKRGRLLPASISSSYFTLRTIPLLYNTSSREG